MFQPISDRVLSERSNLNVPKSYRACAVLKRNRSLGKLVVCNVDDLRTVQRDNEPRALCPDVIAIPLPPALITVLGAARCTIPPVLYVWSARVSKMFTS